jgi:two-component system, OmpR family, sensor histidine kinase KdpD
MARCGGPKARTRQSMRIKSLVRGRGTTSLPFASVRALLAARVSASLLQLADTAGRDPLRGILVFTGLLLKSIGAVAAATGALLIFNYVVPHDLSDLALLVYLAAVVMVATRWGPVAAVMTAVLAGAATAFFFVPPLYTLRMANPQQWIDLLVFLLAALVTGNLAARLKRELDVSRAREGELRGLYQFSRRLAAGFAADDLISAVQDYLANTLARPTILIPPPGPAGHKSPPGAALPDEVRREALAMIAADALDERTLADTQTGRLWLLQAVSSEAAGYGVIAVDLGSNSTEKVARTLDQVRNVLAETNVRLRRLDVARALSAARSRAQSDELRAALIGNVSHELRSPLASILGSASVLDRVPAVRQNDQMQSLVETVLEEAKRLDEDIQKLLDATRMTAGNVRPQHKPIGAMDLVKQAIARKRKQLAAHRLRIEIPNDLPRVLADPALVEQAIGQLIENAAKYSPAGSLIRITARLEDQDVVLAVRDRGCGLTDVEATRIGQPAFRGQRHHDLVPGSGLGLWIAHCFIAANGGTLHAETEGLGLGTTVSLRLRADQAAVPETADLHHD